MKLRWTFSQRKHRIHSIGPKTHVFGRFGLFCYSTKVDARLAELVPLMRKFAKQSRIRIFNDELWQNRLELHQLKYVSPLLRAPACFKLYNPLACRVTFR
jgi:hypothetical protein